MFSQFNITAAACLTSVRVFAGIRKCHPYMANRPFALRDHVTSFYENESYMIFFFKKRLVGPIFSKIIVIWFFKLVPFS